MDTYKHTCIHMNQIICIRWVHGSNSLGPSIFQKFFFFSHSFFFFLFLSYFFSFFFFFFFDIFFALHTNGKLCSQVGSYPCFSQSQVVSIPCFSLLLQGFVWPNYHFQPFLALHEHINRCGHIHVLKTFHRSF